MRCEVALAIDFAASRIISSKFMSSVTIYKIENDLYYEVFNEQVRKDLKEKEEVRGEVGYGDAQAYQRRDTNISL